MGSPSKQIEFEKSYSLDGEKILEESIGVDNLHIVDSILIFSTPALDTLYQIYAINQLDKIRSLVKKGDGPSELNQVLKPLYFTKKNNELLISFYNKARLGIFHLNISKSLHKGFAVFQDTINLEGYSEIYRAYQINMKEVFVDNLDFINLNQIYSTYNIEEKQTLTADTAITSKLQSQSDIYMMATCTIFNKELKKYASGMIFQDQINIYDLKIPENSLSVSPHKNTASLLENAQTIMPLKKEYYVDIREGQSKIFALYVNQTRKDWATGDKPAEIHVIDWNGKPICKLTTKEKLLHFDIDKENNQFYGLTEKQEVIKYDLNQIPELANHL